MMTTFTISRLHTTQGIYRLSGEWTMSDSSNGSLSNGLNIHTIDVMGTDGWLALKQESNTELIDKLRDEIVLHLQSKQ
ncbi:hypothetical protein [Shewanella atlantica]|uniref:Uncharacterized protein n=1 Tax=Shewanella atlantica TaxID=271099 RepID=A0A3S0RMP9_9GAMM|nr:hypothetical protein [Shewanella atlantica]RTR32212.1 hypothetical protein EKG39_12340 [Shewanella atlantica]